MMTMMEMGMNKTFGIWNCGLRMYKAFFNPKSKIQNPKSESGMSLIAIMAVMTIFAIGLLAIAPTVQQEVQREKELESIRRGEEVAEAIRQYITYYRGAKIPNCSKVVRKARKNVR